MCINGLKIQPIVTSKRLALVSFLLGLGIVAASFVRAELCPCLALAVLPQQLRRDRKRPRTAIKKARLESFGFSWEREIAEVKQRRKRKLDFVK